MNGRKDILITKASGEEEIFKTEKLERSLLNAGTDSETINQIIDDINNWIYPGVSTKQIYTRAFSKLKKQHKIQSVPYKLKQAIFELGDSGYPFEVLIGEVFKRQGYSCEVGVVLQGHCITHEMDVVATQGKNQLLVECKYRHDQGKNISIQVPLYVHSRVNDIVKYRKSRNEFMGFTFEPWVITNTRFSPDSMQYSKCSGVKLLGWDFPEGRGLKDLVEKYKIFPVSILVNLTMKAKQILLDNKIVTCRQLKDNLKILNEFELSKVKLKRLLRELDELVG